MKITKIILATMFATAIASGVSAQRGCYGSEKGVSSVGGILGYAIDNNTLALGVDFRYNIGDRIRLAPSFLYTLINSEDVSTIRFNADAHYLARITKTITLYPLAGIGLSNWTYPIPEIPSILPDDSKLTSSKTENKLRVGLNLGFGCESRISRDIIIGAEFRYNLTDERAFNQAMILARVAYYF